MRNDRVNYLAVGSFVLAMLVGLVVLVAVLTGRTGATDRYYTAYRDVSGVRFGTQVLYMGFPVGQVESVEPRHTASGLDFLVELSVREGWKIPEGSHARIVASGLLAGRAVDIRAGDGEGFLAPGAHLPGRGGASLFASMSGSADAVRRLTEDVLEPLLREVRVFVGRVATVMDEDAAPMLRNLNAVSAELAREGPTLVADVRAVSREVRESAARMNSLMTPENTERASATLRNLETISAGLAQHGPPALKRLDDFSGELEHFGEAARNFSVLTRDLVSTRAQLDEALGHVNHLLGENRERVNRSLADLQHTLHAIAQHIDSITYNLEGTTRNMREFSRNIRQNPGLLLGGQAPRDAAPRTSR